jgi:hypothetical protein
VAALRPALRAALGPLEPILALNVDKEVRKDALVITRAGAALAAGAPPGPEVARQLLEATKAIDRDFLDRLGRFPLRIEIPYERVVPLRMQRIGLVLQGAYRILGAWRRGRRLRDECTCDEFEQNVLEMLRLYAAETRALSGSVQLPGPLAVLRERVAQRLYDEMCGVAKQLARERARALRPRGSFR